MSDSVILFEKDFRTKTGDTSLDSFDEIRNIPATGAQRLADGFGMSLPWNIFLLRTPALKDHSMQCKMAKGIDPRGGFSFNLYFHYDEKSHAAGVLELSCTSDTWTGKIGVLKNHKVSFIEPAVIWGDEDCSDWEFEIKGKFCRLAGQRFEIPNGVPAEGRIGFSYRFMNRKFEFLCLEKIKVSSIPFESAPIFERKNWEFPQQIFDSMSPWIFSLEASSMENAVCLHAAVEGGPVNVPNHGTFYTKHLGNEYIENPYVQIVHSDGRVEPKQYIYPGGRVGCRQPGDGAGTALCRVLRRSGAGRPGRLPQPSPLSRR